jgi:hypothetical protein
MPKSGPRTTYPFSNEFKATAVRLSELPRVEVQDVAASFYIHPFMLSRSLVRQGKTPGRRRVERLTRGKGIAICCRGTPSTGASIDRAGLRIRAHGVLEQIDEVQHVPPSHVRKRSNVDCCDQVVRGLLQSPTTTFRLGKDHRSSRLNQQYRVIYRIQRDAVLVEVVNVTAHDDRRK